MHTATTIRDDQHVQADVRRFAAAPFDGRPVETATDADLDVRLFRTTYLPSFVAAESLEEKNHPVEADLAWLRLTTPGGVPTALGLLSVGRDPSAHVQARTSSSSAIRDATSTPRSSTSRSCAATSSRRQRG